MTNFTMLVHNRPILTRQALYSLGDSSKISVTILDDASDPPWMDSLPLNMNQLAVARQDESQGTAFARNRVISDSQRWFGKGEYLYLSDNDVYFKRSDWLQILIQNYAKAWDKGFRVLGAYNHPYHIPVANYRGAMGYDINEVQALALQSMLMHWDVWEHYGPFDLTPPGRVCMGEDVSFTERVKTDGGKVGVIAPALLVNTGITNSFGEKIPGWELVAAEAPDGVIVA